MLPQKRKPNRVACNIGAGGYTGKHIICATYLTEPQGKIKRMPRTFKLPHFYHSPVISVVKHARRETDARKRDLSPTLLDFGPVRFKIARHFGFCYGVENAIEIAISGISREPGQTYLSTLRNYSQPTCQRKLEASRCPVPHGYRRDTPPSLSIF